VAKEMDPEELKIQTALAEHQQNAPKLGFPTDVRTLVQYNHGFAVMSTNSKSNPGFPGGSVVGFAPDELGRPIFIFSGMSSHTQDLLADPKCSLTIASKEFKGAADGRVNLMGEVTLLKQDEKEAAKAAYLAKHPGTLHISSSSCFVFSSLK
jgi:putative heme iron utilization protein